MLALEKLKSEFLSQRRLRSSSLLVTMFGDTVSQHGGQVWLGSLIRALAPLGLDQRLIRTSVFRLVRDGWLVAQKGGRRSFYTFSDAGQKEYERAARRIYRAKAPVWDGLWTVVIPVCIPEQWKERFKKSLLWQGFGSLSNGVYAHPGAENHSLDETLEEMGLVNNVIVMRAQTHRHVNQRVMHQVVSHGWKVDSLGERYEEYLGRFRPIERALKRKNTLTAQSCFHLRTILIREYRRILLHDTDLPATLLPRSWPGSAATRLTGRLYQVVSPGALEYIQTTLETEAGLVRAAGKHYYTRFGGIVAMGPGKPI